RELHFLGSAFNKASHVLTDGFFVSPLRIFCTVKYDTPLFAARVIISVLDIAASDLVIFVSSSMPMFYTALGKSASATSMNILRAQHANYSSSNLQINLARFTEHGNNSVIASQNESQ
ncbi:MAG: hypothetical protein ACRDAM_19375, partial [Casimicrobium sp.]